MRFLRVCRGPPERVVGVERGVKNAGGPDGAWGVRPREAAPQGRVRTVRASEPRLVHGDGSAVHTGKEWTGRRSLPRKHGPTMQDRPPMPTARQGRAPKAESQQGYRFRHLDGRLDEACLQQGGRDIRQEAASGVEQGRAPADAQHLAAPIHGLVARLKQKRYRATRVRRPSRPQGEGTQRPLGMPAVEAKRLPLASARLLAAIDAQDVLRCR